MLKPVVEHHSRMQHPYFQQTIALTTKHKKASALGLPLRAGVGLIVKEVQVDTDIFGTFTGEVERTGTPLETAIKKARLGMKECLTSLGLASEGSFGSHPFIPFIAGCEETIVLVDDVSGFHISESLISTKTNFGSRETSCIEDIEDFLKQVKFPSHALIVKPNQTDGGFVQKIRRMFRKSNTDILKGIQNRESLKLAIEACSSASFDGFARVETDMRAHMNPTRMRVLRELGILFARRLRSLCTECGCPGFGRTSVTGLLNCSECGYPSESPSHEIHSCAKCHHSKTLPRRDGITSVEPMYCQRCNP